MTDQRKPLDRAVGAGWVKAVHRRFYRGALGLRFEVVIIPWRRRKDGTLGRQADRPIYWECGSADEALRCADRWLARHVPESNVESPA